MRLFQIHMQLLLFCLFTKSCPIPCDPMNCSPPGPPVPHHLPEFAQVHVHWISDVIQPSHLLPPSCPFAFNLCQLQSFAVSQLFISGGQGIGASASASVLPMSIQGWLSLGLTYLISLSPRDSRESSPAPQFESISSLVFGLLYGATLPSIHDYWKDNSFDYMDPCQQSEVFAF